MSVLFRFLGGGHCGARKHAAFALRWLGVFGLLAVAIGLSGCGRSDGAMAPDGRPKVLRINVTVSEEEVERRTRAYKDLAAYFAERLGIRVEVVQTAGYSAAIEAMRSGKIDVCTGSPLPYMVARAKFGAVPLVVPALPNGAPSSYHSIFVTRSETGLRSLDDVKARASSLVFAFADPASTSGHLVPRAQLESMGIDAEKDFKQVIFATNHTASLLTVKAGKVDVAAVTKTLYDRMVGDGRLKASDFVVLWTSPPLQQSIVFTRPGLSDAFRAEVQSLYLNLHADRPDIWKGLRVLSTSGATHYEPASDAMFDSFREVARRLEHIKLID